MYFAIEDTTVRVSGSMHVLPATAPNLPDWVWSAFQWTDTIIFEHDVSQARAHVVLQDGDSLKSHLPVDLWNKLEAAWPTDRPLAAISSLKPWMAIATLPLLWMSVAPGVEVQLTERARQENKSIAYLETMADFAELADTVPEAALHQALSLTLAERANAPRNFLDLHQAWLNHDLEQLQTVIARTPFHRMPEIAALLITARNERWLTRILAATASNERTLIAPGALHLLGPNGLLALLQRAGHRVRVLL
jgi:uncharacterized protein YbaP (TraB family)